MKRFVNPSPEKWDELCSRKISSDETVSERVSAIIANVRKDGDQAIRKIEAEVDGVKLDSLEVTDAELAEALKSIPQSLRNALDKASANIKAFHSAQEFNTLEVTCSAGVKCWQKAVPIQKIGIYIPGGSAPLFSTVLMLAIPAKVAGCDKITMCTPCNKEGKVNPTVLYAASLCGVDKIYKIGGAQAIAAMAYGTESIEKVYKIFGPGNRYVMKAKQMVSQDVAIDMPAGPSEVMVIADDKANPSFVAADLLSQAEHGPDSQVILSCFSESFAELVSEEIAKQLATLPRESIAAKALDNSRSIIFNQVDEAIAFANAYAPEHLIIQTETPWKIADNIKAAGSIFIGPYSPESAGDYASGTNHTLPTSGWAKAYSGVNLDSFTRKMTYQELSYEGLKSLSETITTMADGEGLSAHANAVKIRMK